MAKNHLLHSLKEHGESFKRKDEILTPMLSGHESNKDATMASLEETENKPVLNEMQERVIRRLLQFETLDCLKNDKFLEQVYDYFFLWDTTTYENLK